MAFELYKLPYLEDALEPYISKETISFHYGKHHATYLNNLNNLIKDTPLEKESLEDIILNTEKYPSEQAIFNNAAQIWNHTFYWQSLLPTKQKMNDIPDGNFKEMVLRDFGSVENLKAELKKVALSQFGSGWAWLVLDNGKLGIVKTSNASTPFGKVKPLLCIDVWEHAYYLDYQNRRADYLDGVLNNLLNWNFAIQNLDNV
ncbi:MAG: superoxide dismutase [Alphaproteobacteria bacterium]|nr:superoxide dismutase [Alphaproteobacteria bacterium]